MTLQPEELAQTVAERCLERKAQRVTIIDVRGRTSYTDFLVVASGTSDRHVQSIAEHVERSLRKEGIRALGSEGVRDGQWALVDLGSVVVHVFHQFTREVYNLEGLWADAPQHTLASEPSASHGA